MGLRPTFTLASCNQLIRRKKSPPICADAIFADFRELSARTCLGYALFQISIEGESEFSRRSLFYKTAAADIAAAKKTKTKSGAAGSPFLLTFLAKQKSESRRATPGKICPSAELPDN
jgi:hypothetical protein